MIRDGTDLVLQKEARWRWSPHYAVHLRGGVRYVLLTRRRPRSNPNVPLSRQISHHTVSESAASSATTPAALSWLSTWVDELLDADILRTIALCIGLFALAPLVIPLLVAKAVRAGGQEEPRSARFFYDMDDDLVERWDLVVDAWRGLELDGARVTRIANTAIQVAGVKAFDQLPDARPSLQEPRARAALQVEFPTWSMGRVSFQLRPDGIHRRDADSLTVLPWPLVDIHLQPPRLLASSRVGHETPTGLHFADEGQRVQQLLLCTEETTIQELHQVLRAYLQRVLPTSHRS